MVNEIMCELILDRTMVVSDALAINSRYLKGWISLIIILEASLCISINFAFCSARRNKT